MPYTDSSRLKSAVQISQTKLSGEIGKVVQSVKSEYQAALAQEQHLSKQQLDLVELQIRVARGEPLEVEPHLAHPEPGDVADPLHLDVDARRGFVEVGRLWSATRL